MSMDRDGRTERATPRRRSRAREDGQVAVSREIISLAVLALGGFSLWLALDAGIASLRQTTRLVLGNLESEAVLTSGLVLERSALTFATFVLPCALGASCAALAVGFAQTHGLFVTKPLVPDLTKLNPLPKLGKMLWSKDAAVNLLQACGKVAVIGTLTVALYRAELPFLGSLSQLSLTDIQQYLSDKTVDFCLRSGALLALFAFIDLLVVRRRYEEQLKMTKQEIKDEHRDQEGDPEVKRRQRGRARQLLRQRMMAQVPQADVVVVNPTHYAVALRYDPQTMVAPHVLAKGKDHIAARIREIAREHRVPIMHDPPLARALHAQCEINQEIAPGLYAAVARVLAFVFNLPGRKARVR